MKKILFMIFLFQFAIVSAQTKRTPIICIIGTAHENVEFCTAHIIDSILQIIHPDLILDELDSSFFTADFHYKSSPYNESSPVIMGVTKYMESYKVDLRPFDITGRNEFYRKTNFFARQDSLYKDIARFWASGMFNQRNINSSFLIFQSLAKVNMLKVKTLKELNSQVLMNLLEIHNFIYLNNPIDIVESTDSLKRHIEFAHLQKDFWEKRNNVMIQNIILFSKTYNRIVVLCGNLHKYYLVNGLVEKNGNYVIKDFWEF